MILGRRIRIQVISCVCVLGLFMGCGVNQSSYERLTVGSGNDIFSSVLTRVYAEALRSAGFVVDTNFELLSRQDYFNAIDQDQVTVVPDFMGSLLTYLDLTSKTVKTDDVFLALNNALPEGFSAGDYTPAGDSQVIAMPRALAQQWKITAISDLQNHCADLRAVRLGSLRKYQQKISAITIGQTCVLSEPESELKSAELSSQSAANNATVFWATETTVQLTDSDLIVLRDDGQYFRAENIVPIFRKGALSEPAQSAINKVAGELSTVDLTEMIRQINSEGINPDVVVQRWLAQHPF